MTQAIYAVEKRDGETWTVVGERVFGTREAAEQFEEKYIEHDLRGTTTLDVRVTRYPVDE